MMELYIAKDRPTLNPVTKAFLKGHVPFNKGKRWKEWIEDTPENADKWLAKHGFPQADASDFASDFESESDCMIVDLKSK